jgi:antitoxin ParD1/3/4
MGEKVQKSVELSEESRSALEVAVAAGKYNSIDAAIADAIKIWKNREESKAEAIEYLREQIQAGIDSGPGRELDFEELKAEMHAEFVRRKDARLIA